jgi:hypothetical protein
MRLFIIASVAALSAALAAEAEDNALAAVPPGEGVRIAVGDEDARVGCAVRKLLWKEIYALSLYEDRGSGAGLIVMDVVHEGEMPGGLPDDWPPKLEQTVDGEIVQAIDGAFGLIEPGSRVEIAYAPGRDRSELVIDGLTALSVEDRAVYDAIHAMWFGEDPISKPMKRRILSGDCRIS